ncbi:glycosyltransferase family 4 protein [bacterium]|nr:glycosyltransferase family 4 protein [candidate division CSSED10-310 bacterium]
MNGISNTPIHTNSGTGRRPIIGIDVRKLHDFGIGTYIRHLLNGLNDLEESSSPAFRLYSESCSLSASIHLKENRFQVMTTRSGRRSPIQGPLPHANDLTAFHAPHYLVPNCRPAHLILTVHDCIHLDPPRYPEKIRSIGNWMERFFNFSRKTYHRLQGHLRFKKMVADASDIIAVSDSTADSLVALTGIPRDRITRIYNCFDNLYRDDINPDGTRMFCNKHGLPQGDYVLYCGNDLYHKNLAGLLTAWHLLARNASLPLLVLAGPPHQSMIEDYARELGIAESIRFIGSLPSSHMPLLYRGALCLVFPSLAEGFGLPVIEAMMCGIPVLCSDLPVLREISGCHATFFNPADPSKIAEVLESVIQGKHSPDLAAATRFASEHYSLDSFVSGHIRVYNRYLEDQD